MPYYLAYMKAITASALRKNLARYLDEVVEKGERIVIPRNVEEGDGRGVMIVPLEEADDYFSDDEDGTGTSAQAFFETHPGEAARIRQSIAEDRRDEAITLSEDQRRVLMQISEDWDRLKAA